MTDITYKSTITEITVHDASRNVLTDFEATVIKLADEGGGSYITITQGENEIRLDLEELPLVIEAIDRLMMQYKTEESPRQEQSDDKHVLAVGQRWRRGDGKEVEVLSVIVPAWDGDEPVYLVGPYSSMNPACLRYLPNGECRDLADRKDLALVELLRP